jgi:hypothetical protein
MIGYQAESMHTVCEAASTFLDQTIKHHPVLVFEEDILAVVAAQDDMLEPTGQVQAWFARHPQRLRQGCANRKIANLTRSTLKQINRETHLQSIGLTL